MEAEVARRRVGTISRHFMACEDVLSTHHHILPVNCSGTLNSVARRRDNKLMFARQASHAQGGFMRQASEADQGINTAQPTACIGSESSYKTYGTPLFSRPSRRDLNILKMSLIQPLTQGCSLTLPEPPPQFAKPNQGIIENCTPNPKQSTSIKNLPSTINQSNNWSPRMDVAESPNGYVLTMEIPGVAAKDIRVEVNDRNLIVVGKRTVQSWTVAGFSIDSISAYHKREILQGPYQVVWRLPDGVNKDNISAEFMDGFLQVIIPKI